MTARPPPARPDWEAIVRRGVTEEIERIHATVRAVDAELRRVRRAIC